MWRPCLLVQAEANFHRLDRHQDPRILSNIWECVDGMRFACACLTEHHRRKIHILLRLWTSLATCKSLLVIKTLLDLSIHSRGANWASGRLFQAKCHQKLQSSVFNLWESVSVSETEFLKRFHPSDCESNYQRPFFNQANVF